MFQAVQLEENPLSPFRPAGREGPLMRPQDRESDVVGNGLVKATPFGRAVEPGANSADPAELHGAKVGRLRGSLLALSFFRVLQNCVMKCEVSDSLARVWGVQVRFECRTD